MSIWTHSNAWNSKVICCLELHVAWAMWNPAMVNTNHYSFLQDWEDPKSPYGLSQTMRHFVPKCKYLISISIIQRPAKMWHARTPWSVVFTRMVGVRCVHADLDLSRLQEGCATIQTTVLVMDGNANMDLLVWILWMISCVFARLGTWEGKESLYIS